MVEIIDGEREGLIEVEKYKKGEGDGIYLIIRDKEMKTGIYYKFCIPVGERYVERTQDGLKFYENPP